MVDELYDEPVEGRRNPWLAVLWALAGVLLGVGGFLLTQTAEGTGADVVPVLVLPVVFAALAPWVVGAGLGALVGAVFVHAIRWRR